MTPDQQHHHQLVVVGDARSNRWHAAAHADGRSNGWPLGLQPVNVRIRPLEHHLRLSASFLISTPSITSESSSDLDTESTGSFFPEKSTTLGSLIGIHSNSQNSQTQENHAVIEHHEQLEAERTRRRPAASSGAARGRLWCPLLGCGGGSEQEPIGSSSSLAHLLQKERRATHSQRETSNIEGGYTHEVVEEGGFSIDESMLHRNTLFDNEGILPPRPSGAPLRLILQQASPSSSYLSADWNVFNGRNAGLSHHHHHHHHNNRGDQGPSHGRFPTFWPNLCGRPSASLAS